MLAEITAGFMINVPLWKVSYDKYHNLIM